MMSHFRKILKNIAEKEEGYTLLELLVVLVILTLIIGIAGPAVLRQLGSAKSKTAAVEVNRLITNLEFFRVDTGRWPTSEEGLAILTSSASEGVTGFSGPYISSNASLNDPWGNPYGYVVNGDTVTITSFGADGAEGSASGGEDADVSATASGS